MVTSVIKPMGEYLYNAKGVLGGPSFKDFVDFGSNVATSTQDLARSIPWGDIGTGAVQNIKEAASYLPSKVDMTWPSIVRDALTSNQRTALPEEDVWLANPQFDTEMMGLPEKKSWMDAVKSVLIRDAGANPAAHTNYPPGNIQQGIDMGQSFEPPSFDNQRLRVQNSYVGSPYQKAVTFDEAQGWGAESFGGGGTFNVPIDPNLPGYGEEMFNYSPPPEDRAAVRENYISNVRYEPKISPHAVSPSIDQTWQFVPTISPSVSTGPGPSGPSASDLARIARIDQAREDARREQDAIMMNIAPAQNFVTAPPPVIPAVPQATQAQIESSRHSALMAALENNAKNNWRKHIETNFATPSTRKPYPYDSSDLPPSQYLYDI